jgi:hypothetical protein
MDANSSYVPSLELCEGCQVMLLQNKSVEKGLVNGSRGVVVGFQGGSGGYPIVQFLHGDPVVVEPHDWTSNDCEAVKRRQIPLRVAYAVTIHKSQGATLDCALVDIGSSTFECGQAYVALSRVRALGSLYVWNFNPARVMADAKVVAFYESLAALASAAEIAETSMPPSSIAEVAEVAEAAEVATTNSEIPTSSPTIVSSELHVDMSHAIRPSVEKPAKPAKKPRATKAKELKEPKEPKEAKVKEPKKPKEPKEAKAPRKSLTVSLPTTDTNIGLPAPEAATAAPAATKKTRAPRKPKNTEPKSELPTEVPTPSS